MLKMRRLAAEVSELRETRRMALTIILSMNSINFPIFLTLIRLIFSPLFLPLFLVYLLPYNSLLLNGILGVLFMLLSITDFFDGYYARKYNQETLLGKVLDPLADKFLTYSALIGLLAAGKIYFYWVVIFIGREFFVMGLRHVALEHRFSLPVTKLAKFKTAFQMITIAVIIVNPYHYQTDILTSWNGAELGLLILCTLLSLISAQQYYDSFMMQYKQSSFDTEFQDFPDSIDEGE